MSIKQYSSLKISELFNKCGSILEIINAFNN